MLTIWNNKRFVDSVKVSTVALQKQTTKREKMRVKLIRIVCAFLVDYLWFFWQLFFFLFFYFPDENVQLSKKLYVYWIEHKIIVHFFICKKNFRMWDWSGTEIGCCLTNCPTISIAIKTTFDKKTAYEWNQTIRAYQHCYQFVWKRFIILRRISNFHTACGGCIGDCEKEDHGNVLRWVAYSAKR